MARWKPKVGESYWSVDTNIKDVWFFVWENTEPDSWHYDLGNVFKTYEQAKQALEKVKELFLSLQREVKTRKDYTDMLKHYATIGAKGVKTETLVKVVELMTKDVTGEQ